jgi:hypothetical protein
VHKHVVDFSFVFVYVFDDTTLGTPFLMVGQEEFFEA